VPKNTKITRNTGSESETKAGSTNRRNLLKGIAFTSGAAAVSRWKTPVVKQVVLPAHASATGYTCEIRLFSSEDISDSFAVVAVSPPPAYPPGALLLCELEIQTNVTTRTSTAQGRTDANGELIVRETDFTPNPTPPSGEVTESIILRKSCVNPEECDAECELDLTDVA